MRKLAVIIAIILVVPVILAGASMLVVESRWFSGYISGLLSDKLGRTVEWTGAVEVDWSLHPIIVVNQFRIANADWARHRNFARAHTIRTRISLPQIFNGKLVIEQLHLAQPALHLAYSQQYGKNWSFLRPEKKPDKKPLLQPHFRSVSIDRGAVTYRAPWQETALRVMLDSADGQRLRVQGDGQVRGHPVVLRVTGDPLGQALDTVVKQGQASPSYALQGQLRWRGHELKLEGRTQSVTALGPMQFDLLLQGPNADELAGIFGYNTKPTDYRLKGRIQYRDQRWSLNRVAGHLGESQFSGQLAWDGSGAWPKVMADLQISALDLNEVVPAVSTDGGDKAAAQQNLSQRVEAWTQSLRQWEADVRLQLGELQVRETTFQNLTADILLDNAQLQLEPLAFSVGGGSFHATAYIDAKAPKPTGRATVTLQPIDLGQVLAGYGYAHLGQLEGHLDVHLTEASLDLSDSRLHYWEGDQATDVTVEVGGEPADQGEQGIRLRAHGQLRNRVLDLRFSGGPLLALNHPGSPYPVDFSIEYADSELGVEGTITAPLSPKDAELEFHAEGPDPAQLASIALADAPHLPAYRVKGRLVREDNSWYLRDLHAVLGESDVSGNLRWQLSRHERPMVWADLQSQEVHLNDFSHLWSGQSGSGDTAEDSAKASEKQAEKGQTLPDDGTLQQRLQALNARINYRAAKFRAAEIPFDNVLVDLYLQDGLLRLRPLQLGLSPGEIDLRLGLDSNPEPAEARLQFTISRLSLEELVAPFDIADDTRGLLGGKGEFWAQGNSVADLLASLDGGTRLIMNSGRLDSALVEAAGVDLGETLLSILGKEPAPDHIQCLYIELQADQGTLATEHLTIATSDSNILGHGKVNFASEEFNLVLETRPKDFSLFSASSPVRIHGSFGNIKVDAVSAELIARGALAAVGAAVYPPAGLLPLVELGEAEGQSGCHALVAKAPDDEKEAVPED